MCFSLHPLKLTVRTWKWIVGTRSFPFGMANLQGLLLLVSASVTRQVAFRHTRLGIFPSEYVSSVHNWGGDFCLKKKHTPLGKKQSWNLNMTKENGPIPSIYGIFTYIWLIFRVNVGKYTIHGCYGGEMSTTTHLWVPAVSFQRCSPIFFRRAAGLIVWQGLRIVFFFP